MSLEPLKNPKHLSYSDLKAQVAELARRMNLLTMMEAKTIESNAAPKFVFSDELVTLDVPSVADVVAELAELKDDYDESIEDCSTLCETEKIELKEALEIRTVQGCEAKKAFEMATGIDVADGGYFSVSYGVLYARSVAAPHDPTTGPINLSVAVYRRAGDNALRYHAQSNTSQSNIRWWLHDSDGNRPIIDTDANQITGGDATNLVGINLFAGAYKYIYGSVTVNEYQAWSDYPLDSDPDYLSCD